MKHTGILCLAALTSLLFSCTRSVDTPENITKKDSLFESSYIVRNLDSTVLTLTITPALNCYSYANGQTPRPCDVFVEMTCTLSKPITGAVRVEVEKTSVVDVQDSTSTNAANVPDPAVILNLSPGMTKVSITTGTINSDLVATIRDRYKLKQVSVYQPVD